MRIRSIEASDREFFIDRCHAFYKRLPATMKSRSRTPNARLSCSCTARRMRTA